MSQLSMSHQLLPKEEWTKPEDVRAAMVRQQLGELELTTCCGHRVAHRGDWITRDVVTQSIRLYDDRGFQAAHEAVG